MRLVTITLHFGTFLCDENVNLHTFVFMGPCMQVWQMRTGPRLLTIQCGRGSKLLQPTYRFGSSLDSPYVPLEVFLLNGDSGQLSVLNRSLNWISRRASFSLIVHSFISSAIFLLFWCIDVDLQCILTLGNQKMGSNVDKWSVMNRFPWEVMCILFHLVTSCNL